MRSSKLFIVFILLMLLGACGPNSKAAEAIDPNKLTVVATTGQVADIVRNVGQDKVNLIQLLGPGIDPHTYLATEGDIRIFLKADLIFYSGLRLEAQMDRFLEQINKSGDSVVVALGDKLDKTELLNWEPEANLPYDPHIWNDVMLWSQVVGFVRDSLVEQDPANADAYKANADVYLQQLKELHEYTLEQVAKIPEERRILITAHDAFGYYGRAYGLQVEAVQGISTESEASAADIQALTHVILDSKVPAIFVESTISPRTIEAVIAAVGAQGQEVKIGGQLYADALGASDSGADTYISMMRHNIDTIVAALGTQN